MADRTARTPVESLAVEEEKAQGIVEPDYIKVRDQEFKLVDELPAFTMLRLSAAADPKTPVPVQMQSILGFLTKAVDEEDRVEFLAYLEDAIPVIDFEELNEILTEATEIIGGRPTKQ